MPDQFYVAPSGQILRDPADSSPDRPVIVPASRLDITAAEEASILARAATDPVRVALLAAIAGTAAGSARVDPTTGTVTIVTATAAGTQVQTPVSGGGSIGTFASTAAAETAFPAAANTGKTAMIGAAAPYSQYVSDGVAWSPAGATAVSTTTAMTRAAFRALAAASGLTPGILYLVASAIYRARSTSTYQLIPHQVADVYSGVSRTVTGVTTETVIFSQQVLAEYFHENTVLNAHILWSYSNLAAGGGGTDGNKILKFKVGGQTVVTLTATSTREWPRSVVLAWKNSLTSQVSVFNGASSIGSNSASPITNYTIDPGTTGCLIEVTAQLANAADVATLEYLDVTIK